MKYPDMTWSTMEAVVNKLGGTSGVERFLRGETVVKAMERIFPIWKTITLGVHKNMEALKSAIAESGFRTSRSSNHIMDKRAFTLASEETSIDLVTATVDKLGFTGTTRYDAICGRIRELGYDLCPAEVGPQLRLQYKYQPLDEWLVIAMEAITDSDRRLIVFRVRHRGGGQWLGVCDGSSDSLFDPDARFVFRRLPAGKAGK